MAKIVFVLYDDPIDEYPTSYEGDDLQKIEHYPDGHALPTPKAVDFQPGTLLGSVSGELELRRCIASLQHELVVISSKVGDGSELDRHLHDAEVVTSQPFGPAYLTAERIAKATKLKLALTAGIGSDHVDLDAAIAKGVTVAEVIIAMLLTKTVHPPAGADPIVVILAAARWSFLVMPLLVGALTIALALLWQIGLRVAG